MNSSSKFQHKSNLQSYMENQNPKLPTTILNTQRTSGDTTIPDVKSNAFWLLAKYFCVQEIKFSQEYKKGHNRYSGLDDVFGVMGGCQGSYMISMLM